MLGYGARKGKKAPLIPLREDNYDDDDMFAENEGLKKTIQHQDNEIERLRTQLYEQNQFLQQVIMELITRTGSVPARTSPTIAERLATHKANGTATPADTKSPARLP